MPSIHRFEDIDAWQEARALTKIVYALTSQGRFASDRGLTDQVQRASISVMTNIAEGFDSGSRMEFVRFLGYSRRSASEIQSICYAALDLAYITAPKFAHVYEQAEKVRRMVTSFSRYLRASQSSVNAPTRQRAEAVNAPTRQRANAPTS